MSYKDFKEDTSAFIERESKFNETTEELAGLKAEIDNSTLKNNEDKESSEKIKNEISSIINDIIKPSFIISQEDIQKLIDYICSWDNGISNNPEMIKTLYELYSPQTFLTNEANDLKNFNLDTLENSFLIYSEEPYTSNPLWKISYLIHHRNEGLSNIIKGIKGKEDNYNKTQNEKAKQEAENIVHSFGGVKLSYSGVYSVPGISSNNSKENSRLTKSKGTVTYNIGGERHKETYYSETQLPGKNLKIPGRHLAEDGTVRDGDGFIVVACNYLPKGSCIMTTLGPGKVYDRGGMTGKRIDLYVNSKKMI